MHASVAGRSTDEEHARDRAADEAGRAPLRAAAVMEVLAQLLPDEVAHRLQVAAAVPRQLALPRRILQLLQRLNMPRPQQPLLRPRPAAAQAVHRGISSSAKGAEVFACRKVVVRKQETGST